MCDHALSDVESPFHALDCERNQALYTIRHAQSIKVISSFLKNKLADVTLHSEPWFHIGNQASAALRGDIAISLPDMYRILDVTVSNPAAITYLTQARSNLVTNGTNMQRENDKLAKYEATSECTLGQFIPFAIEATGRIGPLGHTMVDEMFETQTRFRQERGLKTPFQILQSHLSVAIAKVNASMTLYHRRGAWRRFTNGGVGA